MLNSISWSQFAWAVIAAVACYYAVIFLWMYRAEIRQWGKGSGAVQQEDNGVQEMNAARPNDPATESDEELLMGSVADLLDELRENFRKHEGWKRDEVLPVIRETLSRYPRVIGTAYQESVNVFIANSCRDYFSWSIEPDEVRQLWPRH